MKKPSKITDESALKYIKFLEKELKQFTDSPLKNSYLSTLNFLNKIDKQIIDNDIDIFAEGAKDKDKFGMAHKFLTEKQPYLEQLEYIRTLMTPEQQKDLQKEIELGNLSIADQRAYKRQKSGK